jgi:hypothetical protein
MLSPTGNNFLTVRGQTALALAARGRWIFPLIPGGKTPAIDGWPERATTDAKQIEKWWRARDYNIGIATGLRLRLTNGAAAIVKVLIVVDYDMKDGQLGNKALFLHEILGHADTETVQTPHGIHKYYWADSNLLIPNSVSRIAINVDVRGARGYVVGPSSIVDGVEYKWIGEDREPAPFPPEFIKLAAKPAGPDKTHDKLPLGELDRPDAIERTKRWLINEAPEAIEGSRGDQTTYQVAAHCKDLGTSEPETLELMLAHWNEEKAIPPWAFDALREKVSNAYHYGQNAPGAKDPLLEFGVVKREGQPSTHTNGQKDPTPGGGDGEATGLGHSGRDPLVDESFEDAAAAAKDHQATPLVKDLIGQGELCAIYGPPGAAKTFVALDLAHCVSTGRPFDGRPTTQGAVLYVAAEGGPGIRTRLLALQTKFGIENPHLRLLRYPVDFRTGEFDAVRLAKLIELRSVELGIKFLMVVIDTLSETLAGGNDTEHMQAFLWNAKVVQKKTGCTVVPVHHPGKDEAKGMRGHSSLLGAVDTAIAIRAPQGGRPGARRCLTVTKQRNIEIPANSSWFALEILDLGPSKDGTDLSSCVVAWSEDAGAEFDVQMTPADTAVFETVRRWAIAASQPVHDVKAVGLSAWLKDHDPENPMSRWSGSTMRKAISRLRSEGHLEPRDGVVDDLEDLENDDED